MSETKRERAERIADETRYLKRADFVAYIERELDDRAEIARLREAVAIDQKRNPDGAR